MTMFIASTGRSLHCYHRRQKCWWLEC